MTTETQKPNQIEAGRREASEFSALLDCPAGHKAEFWLPGNGWVLAGCKRCGHAAAAYKSFEQAEHDWNVMMAI